MIAKAGLGLIGLGALGVGGVALAKPGWLGMGKDPMPEYHSLDKDKDYNATYNSDDKFGKKYGRYLVGVAKEKDNNGKTHQEWWDWAFRRMGKEITNSKFSTKGDNANVKSGYVGNNPLSKVCGEAYKKGESEFQTTASNENITKKEVWKYCSIGGTQPQTIKEFNSKNNGDQETYNSDSAIAKESSEQEKLLSIKSTDNDWIWDLKDKEFRNTTIEGNGYFKKEKDKNNNERKTLKEICKWAYGQKPVSDNEDTKLEKTDVTKYCSLEGK